MRRWRFLLPLSVGVVSTGLMIWDIHNERIIERMGNGLGHGAPVWPYQTAEILFSFLNLPAYLFAVPIIRAYHLYIPRHYIVLFPSSLLWWYIVGIVFDCGIIKRPTHRRWHWFVVALTLCFLALGIYGAQSTLAWWRAYGGWTREALLVLLRVATPTIWSFVIAAGAGAAAMRSKKHD